MTIHQLIKLAIKKLPLGNNTPTSRRRAAASRGGSPALDGEVLLSHVLGKTKEYLAANPNKKVNGRVEKKYLALLNRRIHGWPVAYLVKSKEFFGLKFYIDKNVLVPRPETEGLVELAINQIKDLRLKLKEKKPLRILDMGTGSGNIIISVAKQLSSLTPHPSALFFASDISAKALAVAKKNSEINHLKIAFKKGSLLEPWKKQNFDVIIANLPYGWNSWKNKTSAETIGLKYEPKEALFTEEKGLKIIKELFKQIAKLPPPREPNPKYIFLEFDPRQTSEIKKLAKKLLPAFKTKIYKDLWGKNRYGVISSLL